MIARRARAIVCAARSAIIVCDLLCQRMFEHILDAVSNLSNDAQQDYFSDGLTEDLTTDLSKNPGIVCGRAELGLHLQGQARKSGADRPGTGDKYVLEGNARKSDNQVRITAQLIDTQVVYLDLRGTGRSDAGLTNKWSLEQWPEEIHSFFRVVR
jgi:hypothetical protein